MLSLAVRAYPNLPWKGAKVFILNFALPHITLEDLSTRANRVSQKFAHLYPSTPKTAKQYNVVPPTNQGT